ncbi:hypothetical protein A4X16_14505 [Microbacterium sp. H83]|nr:hypothetical protein A4X16_14505 [Microbacterium sp. H83]
MPDVPAEVTDAVTEPLVACAGGAITAPAAIRRTEMRAASRARMRLLPGDAVAVAFTFLQAPGRAADACRRCRNAVGQEDVCWLGLAK